jgi:hypothetical protein
MSSIIPHTGLTLLEAHQVARRAGMYLIDNGTGDVKVSPIIPPGWREIPIRVKVTAPDRGCVCTDNRVAA